MYKNQTTCIPSMNRPPSAPLQGAYLHHKVGKQNASAWLLPMHRPSKTGLLTQSRRIHHHRTSLGGTQPNAGPSTTNTEQTQMLSALNIPKS